MRAEEIQYTHRYRLRQKPVILTGNAEDGSMYSQASYNYHNIWYEVELKPKWNYWKDSFKEA